MLQKRYKGFLSTPCLWHGNSVHGLEQFEIPSYSQKIDISIDDNLRLGKYVERLVGVQLRQQNSISVLAENIQIQDRNITLGEFDCLLLKDGKPIHLEIIYKFYLYDASVGTSEIDHFIGPNRKDSLIEKLNKLKTKQLPLLYSEACKPYLENLNLKAEAIAQHVYFKAQLFLPFSHQNLKLKLLNTDCVAGFYLNQNQLHEFKDCKFFVPIKKDWLLIPHSNVDWLNHLQFSAIAKNYTKRRYAALFWLKLKTGIIKKVFLVWW